MRLRDREARAQQLRNASCCEYSTNIKWHGNMNWWIMNHSRELSCQNVLEDPWNVWQIQAIPSFAFAEIYLFVWGMGRQVLIFHLAHFVLLLVSNSHSNHITLTLVRQLISWWLYNWKTRASRKIASFY